MRKLVFVIAASIVFIACNQPSNGVKNEVKTDSVSVNVDSTQVVNASDTASMAASSYGF